MKRTILSLSLLAATCSISFAQNTATAQAAPVAQTSLQNNLPKYQAAAQVETDKLDKELTLTADQKTKMNAANTRLAIMHDRAQQSNPTAMQRYNSMKESTYQNILTPDQFKKYKAMAPAPATSDVK